jgi:hypothetical protein
MPARKVVRETTTFDVNDPEREVTGEALDSLDHTDPENVQAFLQQFESGSFKVKVYKLGPRGAEYCFSGAEDVDEETIKAFGGGEYELRVFIRGTRQDTIKIRIADRPGQNGIGFSAQVPETQVANPGRRANSDDRYIDLVEKLAFGGGRQATPMAELAQAMKDLGLAGQPKDDPMTMLLKGIELAKTLGGGSSPDWKTALVEAAKDIGAAVAPAFMNRGTAPSLPNRQQVEPMTAEQQMQQRIMQGIAYLKTKAIAGKPVDLFIDWILDNATDPQYQPFIQLILAQEFDTFIQIDPEIANEPYLTWFRTLHSGLRDAFNENQNVDDSSGATGNIRDITGHGATGKGRKSKQ